MKTLLTKSPYYNKVNTQVCEFRKLFGNVDVELSPQGSLKLIPIPYEELKETEEYKQTVSDMKSQLGKKYIRLDTIAECILRLPTIELQYAALQQLNTLLVGTAWSEKAAEVLETMFAKVKEQQDRRNKMDEAVKKSLERPTTQNSYTLELVQKKETNIDKNYGPNIENNGTLSLPEELVAKPLPESEGDK